MDELDRAKKLEMAARDAAIDAQILRAKETEPPLNIDGVRCCLDCGVAIPQARLKARPESIRCIDCKQIKEQMDRGFR
ncbi:MAG: TraR/DksA C4-type zinc finger protein [Chromatiales bacterium]|nr:TraR/DksA C4-type zinc finger protein [Gammaproteobacteria bacterium]